MARKRFNHSRTAKKLSRTHLSAKTANKIIKLLKVRGATQQQAETYVALVRKFETQSDSAGNLHHILPKGVGWWRPYGHARWNYARVDWHFHVMLHAYLCGIFPDNEKLSLALRITIKGHSSISVRIQRNKQKISTWQAAGKKMVWIAAKLDVTTETLRKWMRSWGLKTRSNVGPHSRKRQKNKRKIIAWYNKRKTPRWIAARLGISPNSVRRWLKSWRVKFRTSAESQYSPKRARKLEIIAWHKQGKTRRWIADKIEVWDSQITLWLRQWGAIHK